MNVLSLLSLLAGLLCALTSLSFLHTASATVPVSSAYLPVRRSYYNRHAPQRFASSRSAVVPLSYQFTNDEKRTIAKRLLRNAASYRRDSLRDVLKHSSRPYTPAAPRQKQISSKPSMHAPSSASASSQNTLQDAADHLFLSPRHNSSQYRRPPISLHVDIDDSAQQRPTRAYSKPTKTSSSTSSIPSSRSASGSSSAAEQKLLRQSLVSVKSVSPSTATTALRVVEELCHSIYNAQAVLKHPDGFQPVLHALNSRHRRVRASAAWALATCCQNNRPVQRALLEAGAVHTVARLALEDVLNVRARALFALNALVGLDDARLTFEKLPFSTQVVIAGLKDKRDFRATRRTLNLVELLVRKNLDAWKTQLEAWDVTLLIENILKEHPNIDVRESAARIISALDGNTNIL